MARIARHEVDVAFSRKRAEVESGKPEVYLKALPNDLTHANMFRSTTQAWAAHLAVADPASTRICAALRLGAEGMAALFTAATAGKGEVEVRLGGQRVRAPAAVDMSVVDPGNWQGGYFLAAICRESALLDALCGTPTDRLRRSSTKGDEFQYLYVDALRAFWRKEAGAPALLLRALKATEAGRVEIASEDYVLDIAVPQMEVLYRLMDRDGPGFNTALEKAASLHRKYWSKGNRRQDPDGYLSFPLTALASFAVEAGLKVQVDSDYLPARLVQGDCRP